MYINLLKTFFIDMNCINLHSLTFALKLFILTACDKNSYHITRVVLQTKACLTNSYHKNGLFPFPASKF